MLNSGQLEKRRLAFGGSQSGSIGTITASRNLKRKKEYDENVVPAGKLQRESEVSEPDRKVNIKSSYFIVCCKF